MFQVDGVTTLWTEVEWTENCDAASFLEKQDFVKRTNKIIISLGQSPILGMKHLVQILLMFLFLHFFSLSWTSYIFLFSVSSAFCLYLFVAVLMMLLLLM